MESLTMLIGDKTAITRVPFAVVSSKSIGYVSLCGLEGFSHDVFHFLIWSCMSPTNNVFSFVQTIVMYLTRQRFVSRNDTKILPSDTNLTVVSFFT
jgi:hypothetical protein